MNAFKRSLVHETGMRNFMMNSVRFAAFDVTVNEGDVLEAVVDGYFHESKDRSAPYFDLTIDEINLLNNAY